MQQDYSSILKVTRAYLCLDSPVGTDQKVSLGLVRIFLFIHLWFLYVDMDHSWLWKKQSLIINHLSWIPILFSAVSHRILPGRSMNNQKSALSHEVASQSETLQWINTFPFLKSTHSFLDFNFLCRLKHYHFCNGGEQAICLNVNKVKCWDVLNNLWTSVLTSSKGLY